MNQDSMECQGFKPRSVDVSQFFWYRNRHIKTSGPLNETNGTHLFLRGSNLMLKCECAAFFVFSPKHSAFMCICAMMTAVKIADVLGRLGSVFLLD